MVDFETVIRSRLLAAFAVTALAGQRVDWGENFAGYPSVRLTTTSDRRDRHMKGPNRYRPVRMQIDAMARDAVSKGMLRDAVLDALEPAGRFDGVRCGSPGQVVVRDLSEMDGNTFVHRDAIDLVIWTDG